MTPAEDATQYEVIVEAQDGVPRVAGSAHTLDEERLERLGYDDVHDVLAVIPGVYVRGEDGWGLRPNIGMRGGNSDRSARIALMEDGVPFAPAPYAAPAAYYFPMVSRMVGLEVYKGPAAIRHGPQTVGGALNLVTRSVPTDGVDAAADVRLGSYATASASGWVGGGTERAGWLLDTSHLSSAGFKELDTGGPTSFNRQDVMFKARVAGPRTQGSEHELEVKLGYGHEDSWETYLGLTAADFAEDPWRRYAASDGDRMRWHRTQAEVAWDARLGAVDLRVVGWHHGLTRAWTKLNRFRGGPDLHELLQGEDAGQSAVYLGILRGELDSETPDQELMRGTNDRVFHSGGVQALARVEGRTGPVDQSLEVGLRVMADLADRLHTERPNAMIGGSMSPTGPREVILDARGTAQALAVHVHDRLDFGRIELHPGFRTEVVRTREVAVGVPPEDPQLRALPLPGLGVLAEPHPDVSLLAGVHRGFSPVPPGSEPETRPESAWSYEAGLRATPGEGHFELVGFASDYTRLVGQCTLSSGCTEDQLDQQYDGGAATVLGLEALASQVGHLPGRLTLRGDLAYTLTDARFRTAFASEFPQFGTVSVGDRLPYVPAHQGSAEVSLDHERFAVAAGVHGRSAMRDEAGAEEVPDALAVPGVVTLDGSGSVALNERCRVVVTGNNLTNAHPVESWRPFGARPMAPRTVLVGVKGSL